MWLASHCIVLLACVRFRPATLALGQVPLARAGSCAGSLSSFVCRCDSRPPCDSLLVCPCPPSPCPLDVTDAWSPDPHAFLRSMVERSLPSPSLGQGVVMAHCPLPFPASPASTKCVRVSILGVPPFVAYGAWYCTGFVQSFAENAKVVYVVKQPVWWLQRAPTRCGRARQAREGVTSGE